MLKGAYRIYWDACIFLSYLNKNPDRKDIIEAQWDDVEEKNQQKEDAKILTSATSIAEVSFIEDEVNNNTLSNQPYEIDHLLKSTLVQVVEINTPII